MTKNRAALWFLVLMMPLWSSSLRRSRPELEPAPPAMKGLEGLGQEELRGVVIEEIPQGLDTGQGGVAGRGCGFELATAARSASQPGGSPGWVDLVLRLA